MNTLIFTKFGVSSQIIQENIHSLVLCPLEVHHPNCCVIECLEKISVNEREMTIGILASLFKN